MRIIDGGKKILLNVIRVYRMEVLPSKAFNTRGSPHLTIGYLLGLNVKDLES